MSASARSHDPIPAQPDVLGADRGRKPLYRIAAAAALITAAFIPIQIMAFLIWPPPLEGGATDWFALLEENRVAGLIDLDLLLLADNVLLIAILLALYLALRETLEWAMLIAAALGFASIMLYLATNPAIQMAALSDRYASATTDAQRGTAAAAGDAMLALWQGTAFEVAYLCGSVAGILIGVVMLQSRPFSRLTAWLAIAANGIGLGLYIPGVGVYISVFSVLFLEVWYVLIALQLRRLGRDTA